MITRGPDGTFYGLSTDDKTSDSNINFDRVENGTAFFEMDTGTVLFWDAANETWIS